MPQILHPLRLTGATILRDGELQRRSLAIAGGKITRGPLPEIDLSGFLILPGIVDLQGGAFDSPPDRQAFRRRDLAAALAAADRAAAAAGVTTAWLAQGWSWEGGAHDPDEAERALVALDEYRPRMRTDLRLRLSCETHMTDMATRLLDAIGRHRVEYVVFRNRLEHTAEMARENRAGFARLARQAGRSPAEHLARIERAQAQGSGVPRHLCKLAEAFDGMGVLYGSQGDADGETREFHSMLGARIAVLPASRRAAAAARAMGDPVLLGAQDVVFGETGRGRLPAVDLIAQGLCAGLVSDGGPALLARAAWHLVDTGRLPLARAWAMISERPAAILRLPDRGRLDLGRRADFCVVNETTRAVEMTVSGGRLTHLAGEAGRRFERQGAPPGIAAE